MAQAALLKNNITYHCLASLLMRPEAPNLEHERPAAVLRGVYYNYYMCRLISVLEVN
jgi:hypothetical protein